MQFRYTFSVVTTYCASIIFRNERGNQYHIRRLGRRHEERDVESISDRWEAWARARDCTPLPRDPPCGDLRPPVSKPRYDIDCSNSKVFIIHKYWCIVYQIDARDLRGAINIPDWTDLFRSEQRLESTDWNMSPWCVWISILGPCIYTPFFSPFRPTDSPRSSTSANLLHLYTLCARDLSIARG